MFKKSNLISFLIILFFEMIFNFNKNKIKTLEKIKIYIFEINEFTSEYE